MHFVKDSLLILYYMIIFFIIITDNYNNYDVTKCIKIIIATVTGIYSSI